MNRAIALAKIALANGGYSSGALMVRERKIVAEGIEAVKTTMNVSAHAELIAIRKCLPCTPDSRPLWLRTLHHCRTLFHVLVCSASNPNREGGDCFARCRNIFIGFRDISRLNHDASYTVLPIAMLECLGRCFRTLGLPVSGAASDKGRSTSDKRSMLQPKGLQAPDVGSFKHRRVTDFDRWVP